jgi:hypothetical protein
MTSPVNQSSSLPSGDDLWAVILREQKELDEKVIEEIKKMRGDNVGKSGSDHNEVSNNSGTPAVSPDSSTEGSSGLFSLM